MDIKKIMRKIVPNKIRILRANLINNKKNKRIYTDLMLYASKEHEFREKYKEELDYFKSIQSVVVFPYEYTKEYDYDIEVHEDKTNKMFYVVHNENKLFFPRSHDRFMAMSVYRALLIEQDRKSPHRYLDENIKIDADTIMMDVGSAEGLLALELVDVVKHVYLFETDSNWIEALEKTFEPWKDKVTIVNKFAADINDDHNIKLDNYYNKEDSYLIKIDVEGAEQLVLDGAKELIAHDNTSILCCTYHKTEDAKKFEKLFNDLEYKTKFSDGYMIWLYENVIEPPYFREGLIRAWK